MKLTVSSYTIYINTAIKYPVDLIPTLLSLSTTRLPFHILQNSLSQVSIYLSKFRTRLSANHALHLRRLVIFLDALKKYASVWLEKKKGDKNVKERVEVMTVGELMQRLGRKVEGINMLEVEEYLRSSKVFRYLYSRGVSSSKFYFTDCKEDQWLFR